MSDLSERAMLATLRISSWSGMMHDQEVTEEVSNSHKAAKEAGRYNKRLVAHKFFSGVSQAHNKARHTHRLLTLPWEDDGTRILSSTGYMNYTTQMKECRLKVEAAVKEFLADPDPYIREAQVRLGSMFNIADYPSSTDLAGKFGFDIEMRGMPEAGDFRAKLSEASTKAIIKDIERRSSERLQNAMNDIFKRVEEKVLNLTEKLRNYVPPQNGNKAEGIIRDSVISNIHQLATEVLPMLNITDDPRITTLQKQLVDELMEHSPEILRADSKVRAQTLSKADKILKKVQSYMA